jgi:hypothetical protein
MKAGRRFGGRVISQGFAAIIGENSEQYRKHFVEHEGKKIIRIFRPGFVQGNFDNDWRGCFSEFSDRIREEIGEGNHALIVSDFTTTGDLEKAASEVVLMDAMQSYFDYRVMTECGIPSITLTGTTEDWDKIVAKTRALSKFEGMEWWLDHVYPIVEQFARAVKGDVDLAFWQGIYKSFSGSGGITASGNLLKLMPYTKNWQGKKVQNPLLGDGESDGLSTSDMVQALSNVPFIWEYYGTDLNYQFLAGHVAIGFDEATNTMRPIIGWAVRPKPEGAPAQSDDE